MFDFANMAGQEIAGQILGFVAMGIAIMSFQARRSKFIMLFQGLACLVWVTHYFLLSSMLGAALNAIAMLRNFAYMFRDKIPKNVFNLIPIISGTAFVVITVFTYQTWTDFLPLIGSLAATVAFFMKRENVLRVLSITVSVFWLAYNIVQCSIAGMLNESLAIVSILVSLWRYARPRKRYD